MVRTSMRLLAAALLVSAAMSGCAGKDKAGSAGSTTTTSATSTPTSPTSTPKPAAPSSTTTPTTGAPVVAKSSGCGAGTSPATLDMRHDLTSGSQKRWYFLTTPRTNNQRAIPLVVDFHGLAEGADVHRRMTHFSQLGQRKGFIVATPNGTGSPVQWNISDQSSKNKDLEFVGKLLDSIEGAHCVDTSRVYATGLSDGALFSSLLACTMADRFAAVAPVAGLAKPGDCHPSRPIPMLTFHGTADPILLFNGGVGDALNQALGGKSDIKTTATTVPTDLHGTGYPAAAAAWAAEDGCGAKATDTRVARDLIKRTYRCPAGLGVQFFIVVGGGHSWPGSEFSKAIGKIVGPTTFSIDATAEIYRWVRQFTLPTKQ